MWFLIKNESSCTSSCFISNRRLKGLHWEMFITTYVYSDCKLASVAEWIRQCTRNPEIVGSIPLEGNFFLIFLYLLRGWFPASRASYNNFTKIQNVHIYSAQLCIMKLWRHLGGTLRKVRSREFLLYGLIIFLQMGSDFKFSLMQKKIFFIIFFLNSCVNLQVRP